ncbi:MAG: NADH-quinone oxidoreductase subunit C [Gammaproteobacteria bacterium]|nr:MAG: NADH-quinone oxidoreductase subunit C [Gammaproteobacteria bacterium]
MTGSLGAVAARAKETFGEAVIKSIEAVGELTLEIKRKSILDVCLALRDDPVFSFEQLIDLCGVDYQAYRRETPEGARQGPRFAVVYHLLSLKHNRRVRLRSYLDDELPVVDSVVGIWDSANWFEREAFDLFGIVFEGHPDLRRILTDYGFIGHPFRKDFPLSGEVEMRYDAEKQRVVYQPVSIEPRVLVPRIIREDGFGGRDT